MANCIESSEPNADPDKDKVVVHKKILTTKEYDQILGEFYRFKGLPIECELYLRNKFKTIHKTIIIDIVQTETSNVSRKNFHKLEKNCTAYLKEYNENKDCNKTILVNIARREGFNPIALCRMVMLQKYCKLDVSRYIKNPSTIEDDILYENVIECAICDSQDGPYADAKRRAAGEEHEIKLRAHANAAGLKYMSEHDMRRLGYDKTPDLKTLLPFMYKGHIYNWIESKASFGDPKSHSRNFQKQLSCYANRFGPGIVIYWHGYHEHTPEMPENKIGILVLADFPKKEHIQTLNIPEIKDTDTGNEEFRNT